MQDECTKCGMKGKQHGSDSHECWRQQRANENNRGEGPPCKWCGARPELGYLIHKSGCPRSANR
jgi:hypothetical protein